MHNQRHAVGFSTCSIASKKHVADGSLSDSGGSYPSKSLECSITEEENTFLGGYWGRGRCQGVNDDLKAKCCVLLGASDGGAESVSLGTASFRQCVVLVTLDLVGLSAEFALRMRKRIARALSLSSLHPSVAQEKKEDGRGDGSAREAESRRGTEHVLVCCSHTHTGPQTNNYFIGMGHASKEYMDSLLDRVVKIALEVLLLPLSCFSVSLFSFPFLFFLFFLLLPSHFRPARPLP